MELIPYQRPPEAVLEAMASDDTQAFLDRYARCGGIRNPVRSALMRPFVGSFATRLQSFRLPQAQVELGKPSGIAYFSKSHVEAASPKFKISGYSFEQMMGWLQFTLGYTCGVGIAYATGNEVPHINLYALPSSQMRGAIGWCFGPPLARNRTIQLLDHLGSVWAPHYFIRTFMHEVGHFLGHYGSGSHSNRRDDLMYPSVQRIPPTGSRCGKSERDVAWERENFGPAWITE